MGKEVTASADHYTKISERRVESAKKQLTALNEKIAEERKVVDCGRNLNDSQFNKAIEGNKYLVSKFKGFKDKIAELNDIRDTFQKRVDLGVRGDFATMLETDDKLAKRTKSLNRAKEVQKVNKLARPELTKETYKELKLCKRDRRAIDKSVMIGELPLEARHGSTKDEEGTFTVKVDELVVAQFKIAVIKDKDTGKIVKHMVAMC